ncbi:hypothetical protein ACQPZX_32055 [Actinoplanes sp. CA-142083]|uniref:hypothetical protein n=1 Tax=Actinoplanes sp. CA-142083 TaxID=3239903 RepID=UPI003D91C422
MRTRHSLTAAIIALIAILIGIIISLLAGRGPIANAEEPTTTPSVAEPAPPPIPTRTGKASHPSNQSHGGSRPTKPSTKPGTNPPSKQPSKPPARPPFRPPVDPPAATPPRLGTATMPSDADCAVSGDGQAFTARFSSLESGTDIGRPSRTQKMTIPVTGDGKGKNLLLTLSGYVFTERNATAKLTVTINGSTTTIAYQPGHDTELMRSLDIPLRNVHSLRITIKVEVQPAVKDADAYLNVAALDGQIE